MALMPVTEALAAILKGAEPLPEEMVALDEAFHRVLAHDAMHEAAQRLVGRHDFTTFRNIACQAKSPVKTLDQLDVTRTGEELRITASAR